MLLLETICQFENKLSENLIQSFFLKREQKEYKATRVILGHKQALPYSQI